MTTEQNLLFRVRQPGGHDTLMIEVERSRAWDMLHQLLTFLRQCPDEDQMHTFGQRGQFVTLERGPDGELHEKKEEGPTITQLETLLADRNEDTAYEFRRAEDAEAEVARLRVALEQYADEDNWLNGSGYGALRDLWALDENGWAIAQDALKNS